MNYWAYRRAVILLYLENVIVIPLNKTDKRMYN
jgi:hypothetical protein